MFGEGGTTEERRARLKEKSSLLDSMSDEINSLKNQVGASDKRTLDKYLQTIRSVETRMQRSESAGNNGEKRDLERPLGVPASYEEHAKLMIDLQVLAFQADVTRVITFQLARETSKRSYPEIGANHTTH